MEQWRRCVVDYRAAGHVTTAERSRVEMLVLVHVVAVLTAAAAALGAQSGVTVGDHHRRSTAAAALNEAQMKEVLRRHNVLRGQEPASDMQLMSWNNRLRETAAKWSERCLWKHPDPTKDQWHKGIGQNLYRRSPASKPINLTHAIQASHQSRDMSGFVQRA